MVSFSALVLCSCHVLYVPLAGPPHVSSHIRLCSTQTTALHAHDPAPHTTAWSFTSGAQSFGGAQSVCVEHGRMPGSTVVYAWSTVICEASVVCAENGGTRGARSYAWSTVVYIGGAWPLAWSMDVGVEHCRLREQWWHTTELRAYDGAPRIQPRVPPMSIEHEQGLNCPNHRFAVTNQSYLNLDIKAVTPGSSKG